MKNQGNITPVKEHNFLVTEPKETKICDLPDKKFKIVVLRKLSEPQVTRESQFNKTRGKKYPNKEKFNRDKETIINKLINSGAEEYNE